MALIKKPAASELSQDRRSHERDWPGLLQQLDSPEAATRRWAVQDLVAHPEASAILVERLARERDLAVREVIFTSLIQRRDRVAVEGLLACLRSEDAGLRNEAIDALKQLPREVEPLLEGLLHDPDPDVRIFVVNILESLCHPQVVDWLIRVIEQDPHVNVCATAVDLLGEVGNEKTESALHTLKQRFADEPYIQFAADLALKRIHKA